MFCPSDIEALAKLLTTPQPAPLHVQKQQQKAPTSTTDAASISDSSKPTPPASINPRDLLDVKVPAPRAHGRQGVKQAVQPVAGDEADADVDDGRETPEYAFGYKQSVTTSDNYLGISGKDPSSASCEHLVLVVQLPLAKSAAEMQLDTTDQQLQLSTQHYKLRLCLPHRVDSDRGSAKFDSKKKTLSITLPITRDDVLS